MLKPLLYCGFDSCQAAMSQRIAHQHKRCPVVWVLESLRPRWPGAIPIDANPTARSRTLAPRTMKQCQLCLAQRLRFRSPRIAQPRGDLASMPPRSTCATSSARP